MLAAIFSMGASATAVVERPRNAEFRVIRNLLILRWSLPALPARLDCLFALAEHRRSKLLPVQFNGALHGHSRVLSEERRDLPFKHSHFSQFTLGDAFLLQGQPGALVGIDLAFFGRDPFPKLFQRIFTNGYRDMLEVLKVGQRKPCLHRVSAKLCALSPRNDATDKAIESAARPDVEHLPMALDHKIGHLGDWHRIQRGVNDLLQVHRCVKYALGAARQQWTGRNCGTTTARLLPKPGRQHNGGSPLIEALT